MKKLSKQIKVKVEDFDIAHGEQQALESCPVALSLHRDFSFARVGPRHVYIECSNKGGFYSISKEGQTFIKNFDKGRSVKPTTITLTKIDT